MMKGREGAVVADGGAEFPRPRALSGIALTDDSSAAAESTTLALPSAPARVPSVALVVARSADDALFASSPVLQRTRHHLCRNAEALGRTLEATPPDACVIDAELPFVSRELLAHVVAHVPTLVILGEQWPAHVEPLENPSVDFIRRPLHRAEVELRISRLLRQQSRPADPLTQLRCGSLEIDVGRCEVRVPSGLLKLRRLELKILAYLVLNERRWIAVDELQHHVLGTSGAGGSVRTHIWEIRNKLTRSGAPDIIQSERGRGYRAVPS
jgi:DNA-binding response OmpR family regulator